MNLYQKMQENEPGKHAAAIAEALYSPGRLNSKSDHLAKDLQAAQHFLEAMAHDQIRKKNAWVEDLISAAVKKETETLQEEIRELKSQLLHREPKPLDRGGIFESAESGWWPSRNPSWMDCEEAPRST